MIVLPSNWNIYAKTIITRSYDLVELNIWSGIDKTGLASWLKNFDSDKESYMAACLLDSLIYRSRLQTYSLIFQLLYKKIPRLLTQKMNLTIDPYHFPAVLTARKEPFIRVVSSVGRTRNNSPAESTYEVIRYLNKIFGVQQQHIINPDQIQDCRQQGVEIFVFIDDFLATGGQFSEICAELDIQKLSNECFVIYAVLTAHEKGLKKIKEEYPDLKIAYAEILREDANFFKDYFSSDGNSPEAAREFYKNIFKSKEVSVSKSAVLGIGALELCYGFEHGFPNNSLPIFYHNKGWSPLCNR